MPPGKAHEDAIEIIKNTLMEDFEVTENDFHGDLTFNKLRPDIAFKNPRTNRWVLIEVGNTDAEKIAKYIAMGVEEIRWYTKHHHETGVYLVAQWIPEELHKVHIRPRSCRMRRTEKELKDEIQCLKEERDKMRLFKDSYVCCSGCGTHVHVQSINVIEHRNRHYAVCYTCKSKGNFSTINQLRDATFKVIQYWNRSPEEACQQPAG